MNNTKIVVMCLMLLMAIFFVGLSLNLIDNPYEGVTSESNKMQQQEAAASAKEKNWLKSIDNLLAPFAPSITPKALSLQNCSRTEKGFKLNEQFPDCEISVTGFSEPFKKLSLIPSNRYTKLKISYKSKKKVEDEFDWPSEEEDYDKINFVILGNEDMEGQIAATIMVECTNCIDQRKLEITFE